MDGGKAECTIRSMVGDTLLWRAEIDIFAYACAFFTSLVSNDLKHNLMHYKNIS